MKEQQVAAMSTREVIMRKIAGYILISFPIMGGVLFTAGSVVYWPTLQNINPAAGGIMFIVGSSMFFVTDFCACYLQPEFSPFSPFDNIGSFRALCVMLGNISFIIGSVYFLPNFEVIIGDDIFIIASIFLFIPQVFAIWGVSSLNFYTAMFYSKRIYFRKQMIWMNILMAIGCTCFFVGTFLFKNQEIEQVSLFREGVIMFIVGSLMFFMGPIIGLRFQKKIHIDPLYEYRAKIHDHFLPYQRRSVYGRGSQANSTLQRSSCEDKSSSNDKSKIDKDLEREKRKEFQKNRKRDPKQMIVELSSESQRRSTIVVKT